MHRGFVIALALFGAFMVLYHAHAWWRSRKRAPSAPAMPVKPKGESLGNYGVPPAEGDTGMGLFVGDFLGSSGSSSASAQDVDYGLSTSTGRTVSRMDAAALRGLTVSSRSVSTHPNNSLTLFR